jgi:xylulokinase
MCAWHRTAFVIGIDLGTHGPKVGIVSEEGDILGWEFEPTPYNLQTDGMLMHDPEEWWQAIRKATHRLLDRKLVPVDDIVAIGPSTHLIGVVPVDRGGQALHKAIIRLDQPGAPLLGSRDTLGHMLYIQREYPEIFAKTAAFLEVKDYINLRLTNKMAASHDSFGSSLVTPFHELGRLDYNPRLLRQANFPREKLPNLKPCTEILGPLSAQASHEIGLPRGVQVVVGAHELQAAALGAGAVADYDPHLYLGSLDWMSCHVPFHKTAMTGGIGTVPSAIPGRYLLINEQEWAASSLDFLVDRLIYPADPFGAAERPPDIFERLNQVAASVPPGSGKAIFAPWSFGDRTPTDGVSAHGSFFNLPLDCTRASMARAVMEGVALNSRWLLRGLETSTGKHFSTIRAVGGGAISEVWLQIFADVLEREIVQVVDPRLAPVRGAAFIALVALACLSYPDIAWRVKTVRSFQPIPENHAIYDELSREFGAFYAANKLAFARLNRAV